MMATQPMATSLTPGIISGVNGESDTTYVLLQHDLLRALYRCHCPSNQVLCHYHLGILPKGEISGIAKHLAECPYCVSELDTLRRYLTDEGSGGGR